jgi:hypothetical protein
MTPVFADMFYFLALIHRRDHAHQRTVDWTAAFPKPDRLLTTFA